MNDHNGEVTVFSSDREKQASTARNTFLLEDVNSYTVDDVDVGIRFTLFAAFAPLLAETLILPGCWRSSRKTLPHHVTNLHWLKHPYK